MRNDNELKPPSPIRTYVENGIVIKVYPPMWAEDSTTMQFVRPRKVNRTE